ncbi:MAG TPA: DoxX family protein [Ferruginibacter sp.]|nr:DoxX family protein [Ferruginibacter sp.]HMP21183.1 DoxX family protein [Ferruginibacter sp.]
MKKLLSIRYSPAAFNTATFLLRLVFGALMITAGYSKLIQIGNNHDDFINFLGLGKNLSFYLLVFAEFFCALLIILGLFTRFAAIPLVIAMFVAVSKGHNWDIFNTGQHATLFLCGFFVLLLIGPGRFSVDGMINK